MDSAWNDAARLQSTEALEKFQFFTEENVNKKAENNREARFGEAVSQINVQPKTDGNVERSAKIFEALARENGGDDLGIFARYFLGRIEQIHRSQRNWTKAAGIYRELFTEHPQHPIAQLGMVKYALIRLYEPTAVSEKPTRVAELEQLLPSLSHPPARRDLHMVLANVYLTDIPSNEKALDHLLAADELGIARLKSRGDTWVRIASLADSLGRRDVALRYFQKFSEKFQRDNRYFAIAQRTRELQEVATP